MLRVRVAWTGPSSPLLSTHYFLPASETVTTATACFTAVATFWNSARAHISDNLAYVVQQQVDQLDLLGNLTGSFVATNSAAASGQDTGDELPFQTQGLVAWTTNTFLNGRRLIGRSFIPGPTEQRNAQGAPDSTYLTTMNAAGAAYAATATVVPVVWQDKHDEIPPSGSTGVITGGVARGAWKVLRSRR